MEMTKERITAEITEAIQMAQDMATDLQAMMEKFAAGEISAKQFGDDLETMSRRDAISLRAILSNTGSALNDLAKVA